MTSLSMPARQGACDGANLPLFPDRLAPGAGQCEISKVRMA